MKNYNKIPVIEPDSNFEIFFSFFNILFLGLNIWYIPVFIGFNVNNIFISSSFTLLLFHLIPNGFFQISIFISLNKAFFSKGTLIRDKKLIFKNYIKTSFFLDFITLLPFYFSFFLPKMNFLFLLRIVKLKDSLKSFEEIFQFSDKNRYILKLFKLYLSIFYVIHVIGCLTHFIGSLLHSNGDHKTWLNKANLIDKDWKERYINSVYYSVLTMITAGHYTTDSLYEKIFSIFSVIILSSTFAYSINTIGIILQEMNKNESELKYILLKF